MQEYFRNSIAVGVGGAMGAVSRYSISILMIDLTFPFATVFVNLVGSFLLGIFTGFFIDRQIRDWLKAGIGVGVFGGFTTMSTFAADIYSLSVGFSIIYVAVYLFVSIIGGLFAAFGGLWLGRFIGERRTGERV